MSIFDSMEAVLSTPQSCVKEINLLLSGKTLLNKII